MLPCCSPKLNCKPRNPRFISITRISDRRGFRTSGPGCWFAWALFRSKSSLPRDSRRSLSHPLSPWIAMIQSSELNRSDAEARLLSPPLIDACDGRSGRSTRVGLEVGPDLSVKLTVSLPKLKCGFSPVVVATHLTQADRQVSGCGHEPAATLTTQEWQFCLGFSVWLRQLAARTRPFSSGGINVRSCRKGSLSEIAEMPWA